MLRKGKDIVVSIIDLESNTEVKIKRALKESNSKRSNIDKIKAIRKILIEKNEITFSEVLNKNRTNFL